MKMDQMSQRSTGISRYFSKRKQFTTETVPTILSVPESDSLSTSSGSPLSPKYNMIAALLSNFLAVEWPCKCFWATAALPFIVVNNEIVIHCGFWWMPQNFTNEKPTLVQLLPHGIKPLPEPMLIHIYVAIWCWLSTFSLWDMMQIALLWSNGHIISIVIIKSIIPY